MTINLKNLSLILLGVAGTSGIIYGIDSFSNTKKATDSVSDNNIKLSKHNTLSDDEQSTDSKHSITESKNEQSQPIYDSEGYDKDGRDKYGFDRNGYDRSGFNMYGIDHDGFNRKGFDKDGYNREGLDRQGFSRNKYNAFGVDRAGHCHEYYEEYLSLLNNRLEDAYQKMEEREFRYALFDSRVVFDETLRLLVQHYEGITNSEDSMLSNLKTCEYKHLFTDIEFINRLHGVRIICNDNNHKIKSEESLTQNKVYFVIMQVRDLLIEAEEILL